MNKFYCCVGITMLLVAPLYAGDDVKIRLTNQASTSTFAIQDSNSTTVATIDAQGRIVSGNTGQAGEIDLWDGSANTITMTATNVSGNYTLTLPTATGSVTNQLLTGDTNGNLSWGPGLSAVKKTTDQAVPSTTLADATGLFFSVKSGVYYQFQFAVAYTSTVATVGLKLSVTNPAFTAFVARADIPCQAQDGGTNHYTGYIHYSDDPVISPNTPNIAPSNYFATVTGLILPSADGILQLRFAAEAAGSVVVKRGSLGWMMTIP